MATDRKELARLIALYLDDTELYKPDYSFAKPEHSIDYIEEMEQCADRLIADGYGLIDD